MILADLGLDDVTIAAALLHDAVEDTATTTEDIERDFGKDVAAIVDGVTKLDRLQFDSKEAQQAATMRKMLVAMAKDIRVLLIKLADRLHNMRTIASLPEAKQLRIAQETLDIYAPLAHRLGIGDVKWQLEDLSFAVVHPKRYAEIEQLVYTQAPERQEYLDGLLTELRERLTELKIDADVRGRPKHYWSIYEKMIVKNKEFDEVQDLVGIRVIVETVKDCYAALGSIHAWWRPVQGRFKDYIAMPKFNLYQSPAHDGHRAARPPGRGADPDPGDAPPGRVRRRRALGLQGGAGRPAVEPRRRSRLAAAPGRSPAGDRRPGRVHAVAEDRPRAGRGLRLHAEGQGRHDADRRQPGRLRVRDPHRGRPPLHRRARQRAARAPRRAARVG